MDLWQLKVFTSVVEKKSFSRAGELIHLSQPTVSSHVKELEDHFGCRLIDRMGREALPTKAGELLNTYAKKLLALRDEAEAAMTGFLGKISGRLAIGGSTIPAGYILPRMIGPFSAAYPEIAISLMTGDTGQIVNAVAQGELEVGIVGAKTDLPHILQEKLLDDEMQLIIPADHKWAERKSIDCQELAGEPFIAREEGSGTWTSLSQSMTEAGIPTDRLKIAVTMGSTTAVIQGIINHAGISILSTIAAEDAIASGHLKSLGVNGLDLRRSFYLTTHKKRTRSPITETFIDFIKQTMTS